MILYEDFDLRIQSDGNRFVVSARRGVQTATEPFELDRHRIPTLENLEKVEPEVVQRSGSVLFEALIHGKIRDLYHQARGAMSGNSSAGVRIRLHFDPRDPRLRSLMGLPWEIVCEPSTDRPNLPGLDARRPIVRVIDSVEPIVTADAGPVERVLLVMSDPLNADALDVERERTAIESALAEVSIRPTVLKHATRQGLLERITDHEPQVVHFIGHGELGEADGEGVLVLENADRAEDRLQASTFAAFFNGRAMPRLVVLAACLTGVSSDRKAAPFAGVAMSLVAAGLPAVIAMQSEISNESAIRFSEWLYRRLARGAPLEAAVAHARQAVLAEVVAGSQPSLDWASPVLFMRGQAGSPLERGRVTPAIASSHATPQVHMPITTTGPIDTQINTAFVGNLYQNGGKPNK